VPNPMFKQERSARNRDHADRRLRARGRLPPVEIRSSLACSGDRSTRRGWGYVATGRDVLRVVVDRTSRCGCLPDEPVDPGEARCSAHHLLVMTFDPAAPSWLLKSIQQLGRWRSIRMHRSVPNHGGASQCPSDRGPSRCADLSRAESGAPDAQDLRPRSAGRVARHGRRRGRAGQAATAPSSTAAGPPGRQPCSTWSVHLQLSLISITSLLRFRTVACVAGTLLVMSGILFIAM